LKPAAELVGRQHLQACNPNACLLRSPEQRIKRFEHRVELSALDD